MNNFESALDLHLKSIADRNLSAFSEFLHPSRNTIIILPNGDKIDGNWILIRDQDTMK